MSRIADAWMGCKALWKRVSDNDAHRFKSVLFEGYSGSYIPDQQAVFAKSQSISATSPSALLSTFVIFADL